MKAKTLWFFLTGCLLLTASCRHFRGNRMVMSDGANRVEVRYQGDIQFNEDETAITRISSNGYLEYWHNDEHVLAGNNDHGVVRVELYEDGKPVDLESAEGKALLARTIKGMIGLGFDVKGRIERIYRKGGYPALLKATDSLEGDYVKGQYFERILNGDSLSAGMVAEVIERIRERMGSDYDKERLLTGIDTVYLKNDSVSAGYLAAVKSMDGDYEKSQALRHFLRETLPVQQYVGVLDAASSMGGSFERSNVLRELIEKPLAEGRPFDSLLNVVERMDGDFEKSNLLKQIIHKDVKEGGSWAGLIRTTTTLGGEYERSNVLVEIGQKLPKTDSLRTLYMNAARTVHSDVDYGRVVKAVDM
jgi:hypothetical protein